MGKRKAKSRRKKGNKKEEIESNVKSDPVELLMERLTQRLNRFFFMALLAFMIAMRILYLVEFQGNYVKSADSAELIELAKQIAEGDFFLKGQSLTFSPLYYYFLGIIFSVFGENFTAVLAFQFLLGLISGVLLYFLARELFDKLTALFTLFLYAFYSLILLYEGQILDASFSILAPTAFLFFLHRAEVRDRLIYWFFGGLCMGLFALSRPNVMLFFPAALLWAYFIHGRERSKRKRAVSMGFVLLGITCCFMPFSIRNLIITGEPVLVTTHGGINFFVGNNKDATGFYTPPPEMPPITGLFNQEVPRLVAEKITGRKNMTDSEASSYWFRRGLEFIKENPKAFFDLTVKKARAFFNGYEVPINIEFEFLREIAWSLKAAFIPMGFIMPLGLFGIALNIKRKRGHLLFFLYFITYSFSVILFFITARYRLPIVPVLLLYAGYAVRAVIAAFKKIDRAAAYILILILLASFINTKMELRVNPALKAHSRGYTLAGLNRLNEAIAYYKRALHLNPRLILTHIHLARIYTEQGRFEDAEIHYDAALKLSPGNESLLEQIEEFRREREAAR